METELERLRREFAKAAELYDFWNKHVAAEESRLAAEREKAWPPYGATVWYVDRDLSVQQVGFYGDAMEALFSAGLLYHTEAEAQREADAMAAFRALRPHMEVQVIEDWVSLHIPRGKWDALTPAQREAVSS